MTTTESTQTNPDMQILTDLRGKQNDELLWPLHLEVVDPRTVPNEKRSANRFSK